MCDPSLETLRVVQVRERKMDSWKIEVRITGHQPRGDNQSKVVPTIVALRILPRNRVCG